MSAVARVCGYPHIQCFAHTLQLAVGDAWKIDAIGNLIIHARKIVSFFSKSLVATQELEDIQKKLGKKIKHVITDVSTRWNSIYYMFERLIEVHTDVVTVLHDEKFKKHKKLCLKDCHWTLMEHLVVAMKPLVSATEVLCSEEFPTAAGVYPLVFALISKHLIPSELDTNIVVQLKKKVCDGLESRVLKNEFWLSPTMIATALDPCFKNLRFLDEKQRESLQNHIIAQLEDSASESKDSQTSDDESVPDLPVQVKQELPSPKKKQHFSKTGKNTTFPFGDTIEITDDTESSRSGKQEYKDFLAASTKLNTSPKGCSLSLNWWRENAVLFPKVSTLAQQYLSIPGTSVPSERAFSTAGLTITQQRASLDPSTADAIIFLNKNMRGPLRKTPVSTSTLEVSQVTPFKTTNLTAPSASTTVRIKDEKNDDEPSLPSLPDIADY